MQDNLLPHPYSSNLYLPVTRSHSISHNFEPCHPITSARDQYQKHGIQDMQPMQEYPLPHPNSSNLYLPVTRTHSIIHSIEPCHPPTSARDHYQPNLMPEPCHPHYPTHHLASPAGVLEDNRSHWISLPTVQPYHQTKQPHPSVFIPSPVQNPMQLPSWGMSLELMRDADRSSEFLYQPVPSLPGPPSLQNPRGVAQLGHTLLPHHPSTARSGTPLEAPTRQGRGSIGLTSKKMGAPTVQQDKGKKNFEGGGGTSELWRGRTEKRKVGQEGGTKGRRGSPSCKRPKLNEEEIVGSQVVENAIQRVGNPEGRKRNDKGVGGCPLTATRSQ